MSTETTERPRIYLDGVHLKGFKSIEDLTINFQKGLNILIGKNGSGKSNFMEFLYNAGKSLSFSENIFQYAAFNFFSSDSHLFLIELEPEEVPFEDDRKTIPASLKLLEQLTIDHTVVYRNDSFTEHGFQFENKDIVFFSSDLRTTFFELGYEFENPIYIQYNLSENLAGVNSAGIFKINDKQYSFVNSPKTLNFLTSLFWSIDRYIKVNGSITERDIDRFFVIDELLKVNLNRFSTIEDIRFKRNIDFYKDDNNWIIDNVQIEFRINGNWLRWPQLSDGTKRLFYIIAEVAYNKGLILIEEPELGIHPHQFNLLMDFLKEQSQDKQIIISTHSPQALDILSPDELDNILITYYDKQKGTQIRHLDEHQKNKAKLYMKEVGFFSDYWLHSDLEE